MKTKVYTLLSFCVILLYSCYSDEGNYDYKEINEVKIKGLPNGIVTKFKDVDTLKIQPTLENTQAGENYEYTWTAVLQDGKIDDKFEFEIGKEKDLSYLIKLPLAKYYVYLEVLDKTTQVTWRQKFDLEVITATTSGWIVLSDQAGMTQLDMISQAGEDEFMVRDLLKDFNLPNKKGPKRILMNVNYSSGASSTEDKIILITETGSCYLDPEYLTWEEAFDLKYEMGMLPEPFIPTCVTSIAPRDWSYTRNILLTTTEVYCKNVGSGYIYELPKNNILEEEKTFKVAPVVITSGEDITSQWEPPVILYDTDNNRFVQLDLTWNGTSCRIPTLKKEIWPMVTGKDFVYATNTRQNYASSFIILRDNNNKLWLHGLGNIYQNSFAQLEKYYYQLDAPDIERAKLFAVHTYYYFLFYVVDNQIYQFDMVTKESRKLTPKDKDGNDINFSGEEITFIKFNLLQYGNRNDPNGYGQSEYCLIVGSTKGGETGGMIRMLNIKERMNDEVTLYKEYPGFAKPIDIVLRERK